MPIQHSSSLKIKIQEGPVHIPFLLSPLQSTYLFKVKNLSHPDIIILPTLYTYSLIWHFNTKDTCISPSCCSVYMLYQLIQMWVAKISCTSQHVLFGNFTNLAVRTTISSCGVGIHNNPFHTGQISNSLNTMSNIQS